MELLPVTLPGLLSPFPVVVVERASLQHKSWWMNALTGAAGGAAAGPVGAAAGAALGIMSSFMGSGYDAGGGGEIRRQLAAEDPAMVNAIVAWARTNRPDWYDGTGDIYEGDGAQLHQLEDAWRAEQLRLAGKAPDQLVVKKVGGLLLWLAGGLLLMGLVVVVARKLRK